jgi:hypothetical protein
MKLKGHHLDTIEVIEAESQAVLNNLTEHDFQYAIKKWQNSGNACCHSVQKLLSSHLLSKSVRIRMYKTIILPVVLYGCEPWSLMLREEHKLSMFENRVLRRMLGLKRD